ncbi:MAG TPA: hypothetical protein VNU28_02105, partial [Solirubrobacteraceae bacterium]|nr:hypothetical protein [Solirubrobacteraceae bacterium]
MRVSVAHNPQRRLCGTGAMYRRSGGGAAPVLLCAVLPVISRAVTKKRSELEVLDVLWRHDL